MKQNSKVWYFFTRLFHKLRCFTSTSHSLFVAPKEITVSVSGVTTGYIDERTFKGKVYSHWFAVGMYDLRRSLETKVDLGKESQLQLHLLDDEITLEVSRLRKLLEFRKIIIQDSHELPMTSGLAVALDHFLFACQPDKYPKGFCCHQMPIKLHSKEKPDITVFPYPRECFDPTEFVALTDVKLNSDHDSKIKSLAYAMKQQGKKIDKIRLVVAMTTKALSLYIYVPITGLVLYIDICNDSESSLSVFFCMLYAGVHYLLNHPIQSIMIPQPLKDLEVTGLYRPHVLRCQGFVYKLFDTESENPNLDIVKLILPEAEVKNLSEDGRYCLLKYQDREGNGSPNQKAFRQILSQLHEIHEIGYVHSDIREANIVFGKEEAWIIDFDLVSEENKRYPYGYNHSTIKERHPEARALSAKKKIHDVYALDVIMKKHKFSGILEQYELGTSLLQIAESVTEAMEVEN